MRNAVVRARVDAKLKHDVEGILSELGLSMSDTINALFSQIKLHEGLPFEVKIPNKTTRQTFADTDAGNNLKQHKNLKDLFKDLDI